MPSYALPGCEDAYTYEYRPSTAPARVQPRQDGRYDTEPRVHPAQRVGAMQRLSLTGGDHVSTHSNSALAPLPQAHSQPPHSLNQQQGMPAPGIGYTHTPLFSASSGQRHTNAQLHALPQAAAPAPGARSRSAGYSVPPGHAGSVLQDVDERPGLLEQSSFAANAPPPLSQHRSLGSARPLPAVGSQSTAPAELPRREVQHDVNATGQSAATLPPACLAAQAYAAEPSPRNLSRCLGGGQEPARARASGAARRSEHILGLSCYGTDSQSTGAETRPTRFALCGSAVVQYRRTGNHSSTCQNLGLCENFLRFARTV